MLGRTAGGLYWMFRHLERSENTARLLEAGLRIALTRSDEVDNEWESVVTTAGQRDDFLAAHDRFDADLTVDFLLRDRANPSSVRSVIDGARANAREVRTALTREVWEATNHCWMAVNDALRRPVSQRELPAVLGLIRQESAQVRGVLHGTMMRNDIYNFCRLGTYIERVDNTARILDVKYYVLLPSAGYVGSSLDNVQWETILRSVSALRAYRWQNGGEAGPLGIAEFLILDPRMPRSLAFCHRKVEANLGHLASTYGEHLHCHELAHDLTVRLAGRTIDSVFDEGLHQFLGDSIAANNRLGAAIERDYRFAG